MTDMRRTLLWGVFLVSLVLLYDAWNKYTGHPSMFAPPAPRPVASAPATPGSAPAVSGAAGTAAATVAAASASASAPAVSEKVEVTTDLYRATFDTRGASLVRLELLQQHEPLQRDWKDPFLDLFRGKQEDAKGRNVVLFQQGTDHEYVAQSGLAVAGPNHLSVMKVVAGERALKEGQNSLSVAFEGEVNGVKLVKTYAFKRGSYVIDVRHEVVNGSTAPVQPQLYVQLVHQAVQGGGGIFSGPQAFTGPALYTESDKFKKVEFKEIRDKVKDLPPDQRSVDLATAQDGWAAMLQHYYASAWMHDATAPRTFYVAELQPSEYAASRYAVGMKFPLGSIAAGASKVVDTPLFAGPEEERTLAAAAPGLDLVRDYGIFTLIAKPMFWLLEQLHKLIGNWGWAIVALVVLLKAAFYWLNASAYRSMAKMKAISPKIQALNERYKDNPQQKQQEMMRIYREEKVNPLGGCLPIFVQMPFFIALYSVLLSSVEMRNAPWIGWIHDLSATDPYLILPLLMTCTSVVQVALGAKPPDPVQAKMMWIMPLAFSLMFFVFPAGLVLYWLTNNLLSIAQQYVINKRMGVLST
jgi:YidC/Oxa1 family membrane protein insertase